MSWFTDTISKIKNNFSDDKGFFRGNKFTPVTQLTGKSLSQQMNPQMVSPLGSNAPQNNIQYNQQLPTLQVPKPTFKTQAAEKLNARLDDIKRFGVNAVNNITDDKGFVRQGQIRPLAPIGDILKKTTSNFINEKTKFAEYKPEDVNNFYSPQNIAKRQQINSEMKGIEGLRPIVDGRDEINNYIDAQPRAKWLGKNIVKPVVNTGISTLDRLMQNAKTGQDAFNDVFNNTDGDRNIGSNIAKTIVAGGGSAATIPGAGFDLLSQYAEKDVPKAFVSSISDMLTGTTLPTEITGGDSTPVKMARIAGNIAGWAKNPINKEIATAFNTFAPYKNIVDPKTGKITKEAWTVIKSNKFLDYLITRGGRGLVEQLPYSIAQLDNSKSFKENLPEFVGNEAFGAVSEIISDKVINLGGKVIKDIFKGKPGQTINNLFKPKAKVEIETPKNSTFHGNQHVTVPTTPKIKTDNLPITKDVPDGNGGFKRIAFDPKTGKQKIYGNNGDGTQMAGAMAGIETYTDENGQTKVRFNPEKAGIGLAVTSGIKSKGAKQLLDNIKIKADLESKGIFNVKMPGDKKAPIKSIGDIFGNLKNDIGKPKGFLVKGQSIDAEQLIKEGWQTDQVDYAIKLANDAKISPNDVGAYVRGILKKQYPLQASKMGKTSKLPVPPEIDIAKSDANAKLIESDVRGVDESIADMQSKFKQLEESGYTPNPEIKPEVKQPDYSKYYKNAKETDMSSFNGSKTEPKTIKVTTPDKIVNPRANGEVIEPKITPKKTIKEVLSPEQQKIRDSNKKEIEKLLGGKYTFDGKVKTDYKLEGQNSRYNYKDVETNKIADSELRAAVKDAKSYDAWAETSGFKNTGNKSDDKWANVAKIEEKLKALKTASGKRIINVPTPDGMETKFVDNDYAGFDSKPSDGGKAPKSEFTPPTNKQFKEKTVLTPDEITAHKKTITERLTKWAGKVKQGKTLATDVAMKFKDVPENLKNEIINARENPDLKVSDEASKYAGEFGSTFDSLFKVAENHGLEVEFRDNFFTHLWDVKSTDKLIKDGVLGRSVSGTPYFTKGQKITWQEGIDMGLKPRFKTAQEALEAYSTALYKSIANKELIDGLKKDGLAFDEQKGYQFNPVKIAGYRNAIDGSNVLYLPNESAKIFEKVFNPKEAESLWEKGLEKTAKFGKGATQIVLSGGYRTINAMGIGKLLFKELPSGNFKAFKRFGQSLYNKGTEKLYKDIAPDIKKYQSWGIDIGAGKQSVTDYISNKNMGRSLWEKGKKLFKDNMESPTFDYFIPATQVDFARGIEKAGLKQGLSPDEIKNAVVKAMKQHYDIGSSLDSMLKNKNLNNLLDSVFFAKSLRKSTIMSNAVNTIKGLGNPTALENRGNMKQVVGSVIALSLLNEVNKASTGNNMWENPDGWQYAYIKYGENSKGEAKYVRLNTTGIEYTWLTQSLNLAKSIGDGEKTASAVKAPLQFGISQVVDLMSNTDYKMDKIWDNTDTGGTKAKKISEYLATEFSHPIIKNTKAFFKKPEEGKPEDEQKVEKLLGGLTESPIAFKTQKNYETANWWKSVDTITSKLSDEDKKLYESINLKEDEFGAKQRDKVADAQMLVNHPEVMKAQRDVALLNAKKNKTTPDPLYTLTDEQLKTYYQIQGLTSNKDAQKALKDKNKDWYTPLTAARGDFFNGLVASGKMAKQDSEYPTASPETQNKLDYLTSLKTPEITKKQDYYYTLPSGTGERSAYIKANPDLKAYWDTKGTFQDANPDIQQYWDLVAGYNNKVGEAFGIEPEPIAEKSSGSGWKNWGSNKKTPEENLKTALDKIIANGYDSERKLSKSIKELLAKKPSSAKTKTIGTLLKSKTFLTTHSVKNTDNLKRVKRKIEKYY